MSEVSSLSRVESSLEVGLASVISQISKLCSFRERAPLLNSTTTKKFAKDSLVSYFFSKQKTGQLKSFQNLFYLFIVRFLLQIVNDNNFTFVINDS